MLINAESIGKAPDAKKIVELIERKKVEIERLKSNMEKKVERAKALMQKQM